MKKFKLIGCGICVLLMAGCTDHSRNLNLTIKASDDAWVELDIESLLEKRDNEEDSASTVGIEGKATVPISGVPE